MSARRNRHLDAEMEHARGSGLRKLDFAWFLGNGVPGHRTAWHCAGGFDLILRDSIVFDRGGRFEFARFLRDPEGDRVATYTLLARDAGGAPLDVVAWHPRTGRLATWLGRAGLLGLEHPCPATAEAPLVVYRDPVAWLADERRGVVVVDERLARAELLEVGTIQAADLPHGEALEVMLSKVRLPRIVLPAFPNEQEAA